MRLLLLSCAVVLELISADQLRQSVSDPRLYLLLHALSSLAIAGWAWLKLPQHYKASFTATLALFFTFAFLMPVFGLFITITVLLFALHHQHSKSSQDFHTFEVPVLEEAPGEQIETPLHSPGGIRLMLLNSPCVQKRLDSVLYTRNLSDKEAVPLLRIALKDDADDVRLLAYSLLDRKESAISDRIQQLKASLEQIAEHAGYARARTLLKLAESYWELSYLGFSEGELRQFTLQQAQSYLQRSLELDATPEGRAMMGRIYLKLGYIDDAEEQFQLATRDGLAAEPYLSYMAEAAFLAGEYDKVRDALRRLPDNLSNAELQQLREYWL
ncbi:hypothetical protein [Marinobacterium jannaschii]|uniref:hypothetical protein n=1 Tax=Marinobacterium jannaschii TaxID=64970 RepID=UPI000484B0CC|nr:hypothetical protein [Marinobacterium jannaschii]